MAKESTYPQSMQHSDTRVEMGDDGGSGRKGPTDHEVKRLVLERLDLSLDCYASKRDDFLSFYEAYRAYRSQDSYPWESNLVIPVVFDTIETLMPHVVSETFKIRGIPGLGADPGSTPIWNSILDHDCDQMNLPFQLVPLEKQAMLYGFSPYMMTWHQEKPWMKVREFNNVDLGGQNFAIPTDTEKEVTLYDGPHMRVLDVMNFFPQPGKHVVNGYAGEGMDWCLVRFVVPIHFLLPLVKKGIISKKALVELAQSSFPGVTAGAEDAEDQIRARQAIVGLNPETYDKTVDQVEIICMFGDRGFRRLDKGLVWLGNRNVVLRDEPYPWWHGRMPLGVVNDVPIQHELMGIGSAELALMFQDEKSDIRNARMDNFHQIVNKMWLSSTTGAIDDRELISRPGGIVHTDDMGALELIGAGDMPMSTYREEQLIDEDTQRVTGALDVLRGMSFNTSRPTATSDQIKANFGAARTRIKTWCLKHQGLAEIGRFIIALRQQFTSKPTMLRIQKGSEQNDIWVKPEDIAGRWDVRAFVDDELPMGQMAKQQRAITIFQMISAMMGQAVVPDKPIMMLLEAFEIDNPASWLVSQQQAQQAGADPRAMVQKAMSGMNEDAQMNEEAENPNELVEMMAGMQKGPTVQ